MTPPQALTLRSICSSTLVSITNNTPVPEALHLMSQQGISSLVVLDDTRQLTGLITERDLILMAGTDNIERLVASDIMTSPVITASASMEYHEGYHLLARHDIRHLTVVDDTGYPIGMVTATDFIQHLGIEYLMEVKYVDNVTDSRLHFIAKETSLKEAFQEFSHCKTSCLLIGSRTHVQGILTEGDIVRLLEEQVDIHSTSVEEVMSTPVYSIPYGTPLSDAREQMITLECHRLLVTDKQGHAAGTITRNGLISGIQSHYIALLQESIVQLNQKLKTAEKEIQASHFAQALKHIAARMLNATDIDTLMSESITDLRRIVGADRVRLLMANDPAFSSATLLYENCSPDVPGTLEHSTHLPLTPQLSAVALRTMNQSGIHVSHDTEAYRQHDDYIQDDIKTIFCAPIRAKLAAPAILTLHFCKETREPSEAEIGLLQEFTAYFSSAMTSHSLQKRLSQDIKKREATEQHLQNLLNTLPHGIQENDLNGLITFSNPAHHRILGYEPEELVGKYIWDICFRPEEIARTKSRLAKLQADRPAPYVIETTKSTKQGSPVDIRINWCYQYDQQGKLSGLLSVITDITQQNIIKNELLIKDRAVRSTEDGVVISSAQGDWPIIYANPAIEQMTGYCQEELLGRNCRFLQNNDRNQPPLGIIRNALEKGHSCSVELRNYKKNGQLFWVRISISPVYNDAGVLTHFIGIQRDITASKAALVALEDSEHKYQAFFEDSNDAILVLSAEDWSVFEANPKANHMFGFADDSQQTFANATTAAAANTTAPKIIITDLSPFKNTVFDSMLIAFNKGEQSYRGHGYCVSCSGQRIPVEISATQLKIQHQRMVIATLHDQSFQIEAEERLQQSAIVFENSLEGVIITDAFTRITSINKAFKTITGYSAADVLGKKPAILRSGRHDAAFYDAMWSELRRNHQWTGEIWNRRKNGEVYPQLLTMTAILDKQGDVQNYVAVFSDVSALKESQQALEHQAHYDALTGLPNKLLLESRVQHLLSHQARSHSQFAVLFLDLDHFKNINDSLGHVAGDTLLVAVTERLQHCIRQDDTLARLGGDEFVFIMENILSVQDSALMAEKMIQQFIQPFSIEGQDVYISVSIGITLASNNNATYDELIRNADAAMYQAKAEGRNTYQYYSKEMTSQAFKRLSFEAMMRQSLQANDFELYYQPQIRLSDEKLIGYEALIRWQHPTLGLVMPDKFISIAEESSIILALGEWVLIEACRKGKQLLDDGKFFEHIAVNVSVQQLKKGDFLKIVISALNETGFPANKLEIEITESFLMGNELEATRVLTQLRNMGIRIAIDDFGTGYSSLSYLKQLPIDTLKIDRSFIQHLPGSPKDSAIVQTVIALGTALGLEVLAEGVETPEQRDLLLALGCYCVQGYLYSKPLPAEML
ncbi:EAL domain-containing protein [Neptunomonas antarctica]|uniref:PAS domain S-box-containing protein/diguanylate cyclase (GGDEF) domain-containing protein n=1 Tax=Neptunomonas antarctica TaxID=619304 RepID=A0A1N7IWC9_9GAMM|nr:EAL domain-containing protein [Neptunomonas antarctica]SIS41395.1 PAS domain S-box-containing protein/diguanylate cyclase (GGDEF) domain-containing protein [Neptunomonas antarctica]